MNPKFTAMLRESTSKNVDHTELEKVFRDEDAVGVVLVGGEGINLMQYRNELAKIQAKYKTDYELKMMSVTDDRISKVVAYINEFKRQARKIIAYFVAYDPDITKDDAAMQQLNDKIALAITKAHPDYFVQRVDA